MTGALGITTVPLPAFWSSSKIEDEQSRRPFRKAHLCQNPRCAANKEAYTTPSKEPPAKRIRRPLNNSRPESVPNSLISPAKPSATSTESESLGIRALCNGAKCADCHAHLLVPNGQLQQLPGEPSTVNSKDSTAINSKGSASPASSRSNAPSVSVRTARVAGATFSPMTKRSETRSCSPPAGRRRSPPVIMPMVPASVCHNRYSGDGYLIADSPQGGSVAPPPSERDEDEALVPDIQLQKPTTPLFHGSSPDPISTPTSTWPAPSPVDLIISTRPGTWVSDSTTSEWPASMPHAHTTPEALTPQLSTNGFKAAPIPHSVCKCTSVNGGTADAHARNFRQVFQAGDCTNSGRNCLKSRMNMSTCSGLSTMATTGQQKQIPVPGQNLDDDQRSTVTDCSDLTASSDSRDQSSCSTKMCSGCGKTPVSSFYNALYTPDRKTGAAKAQEVDICTRRCHDDRKLRVAIKIGMLSAMVTLLVVVFSPIILAGLRLHFYGCCACPTSSGRFSQSPQHHSQLRSCGHWVDRGVRDLFKCPLAQQPIDASAMPK